MGTNTTNDRYGESPARAQMRHAGSATIAAAMTNDIRVSKTEPSLLPTPWISWNHRAAGRLSHQVGR